MTPIVIIGTGFSGLGLAIRLKLSGRNDFVILERASEVGGTWRDNVYPGCACDVQSHLYSFSFAPNPEWSRAYSPQPEILSYLKACVEKFDLSSHIRFNCAVESAAWNSREPCWEIATSQGEVKARSLVLAVGPLSEPALPKIEGLETFPGARFHSAQWAPEFSAKGLRVGVVGNGASAVQFIPILQKQVSKLISFQRTPAWVVPQPNRKFADFEKRILKRVPTVQASLRGWIFWTREIFSSFFRHPKLMKLVEAYSRYRLKQDVSDPVLRAKLTPTYTIGCKRILLSDTYWKALASPNADVVTDPILRIEGSSVVTEAGRFDVDALIFATGFRVTDSPFYDRIRGTDGVTLTEAWQGSPKAYLGLSHSGFPNLFFLLGPNTGLGHTSVVLMVEAQIDHLLKVLERVRAAGLTRIEPDTAAQAAFVARVDRQLQATVWNAGGCKSWYLDRTGRNSTIWPKSVVSYRNLMNATGLEGYVETKDTTARFKTDS